MILSKRVVRYGSDGEIPSRINMLGRAGHLDLNNRRSVILLAAIVMVTIGIVAVVIWGSVLSRQDPDTPQGTVITQKKEDYGKGKKILDTEREILVKNMEEGIRDMGLLVTEEYYFTDTVTQSKVKTLFSIPLGFTETAYVATYDGVVTAGIDFEGIGIELDLEGRAVTVRMPEAEIQNVDIDPNSFVLYSEKNGLGNPLSVSDFNDALVELEDKARTRALERGLLEKAGENARRVVVNFIGGFLDLALYDILWESE